MNFSRSYRTLALASALTVCAALPAAAHHFWVVPGDCNATAQTADIVYGHHFPTPEAIPAERTVLFDSLKLVTADGPQTMVQKGENFHYESNLKLDKGSYLIVGEYKPTFWSNGDAGWQMVNMKEYKGTPTYGEEATLLAKTIIEIDGGADAEALSKPVGQKLEIVPLAVPSTIKVGQRFPIKVLFDGKPAKTVEVKARYAGYSDQDIEEAYYGRTDLDGLCNVIISHDGLWAIEVTQETKHPDQTVAQEYVAGATLTFNIAK